MNGEKLVALSILENRTVTEYPSNQDEFDSLYDFLLDACSGDCDPQVESGDGFSGAESRGLVRFWGETSDGEWTVEIVRCN